MYLYILTLHSGAKPAAVPAPVPAPVPAKEPQDRVIFPDKVYLRPLPSVDPCGILPLGQAAESSNNETKTLAARLWYSKEFMTPETLETILKKAYKFGFGYFAQLESPEPNQPDYRFHNNTIQIHNESDFHFCATRVEFPEGMKSKVEEEILSFWDASGAKYSLRPNYGSSLITADPIQLPYIVPPKEFRTLEDIRRFADYVESLAAFEKAKASWRGGMCSEDNIVGKESDFGYACPTDAFEEHSMFFSANRKKHQDLYEKRKSDRILVLKQKGSSEVIQKALMPCDMTPWFGTDLLPEFEVVKAVEWAPDVGFLDEPTLAALMSALKAVPNAAPTMPIAPRPVKDENKVSTAAAPQFPHQEDLDVLWDVFTREYIQRPKRAGGLDHARIPNSILLAVWKILALQPKSALLYGNPKYENSILRKKDLPKNWAKVITPEILTEYFYAKDEKFQGCILYTFYNRGFLQTLLDFYDTKIVVNDNINWHAFPAIDPNPIVLALTNPAGLTDEHKKAWVSKFIRDRMETKEKAVAGSQETYSEFLSWVRSGHFLGIYNRDSSHSISEFLAQFPQAEFTRLMKENGLAMTRRSRGMVFVGATLLSSRDDNWTLEGNRVPAEGEVLPFSNGPTGTTGPTGITEPTGTTGTTEPAEMLAAFDANEEGWGAPIS